MLLTEIQNLIESNSFCFVVKNSHCNFSRGLLISKVLAILTEVKNTLSLIKGFNRSLMSGSIKSVGFPLKIKG